MGIFQTLKELRISQKVIRMLNPVSFPEMLHWYNNLNPDPKTKELPNERRSCYDCCHLKSLVSLWCSNEQAIIARGTRIPGVVHCPYWELDPVIAVNEYKKHNKQ